MLPSYYQHVSRYENSLVTKFFGVHCVKPIGGQKVCVVYKFLIIILGSSGLSVSSDCVMWLESRLGLLWWAIYSAQSIVSIGDLTLKDPLMAARQICLRVRLMKPQPSRTLILILCFASSRIGSKSSSSKFSVQFISYFNLLYLAISIWFLHLS